MCHQPCLVGKEVPDEELRVKSKANPFKHTDVIFEDDLNPDFPSPTSGKGKVASDISMQFDQAVVDDGGLVDPSVELFQWMLLQMWPNVNEVAKGIIKDTVEPQFDKELDKFGMAGRAFKPIAFSHFEFGDSPPRIEEVRAYRQTAHEHYGIEIDCVVRMHITPKINLVIKGYDVGLSRLHFEGHISCIFKPLMKRRPVIGGVQVFLLRRPTLDFDLSGSIQGINGSVVHRVMKNVVVDQICKRLALPNRVNVNLVKEWELEQDIAELNNPRPQCILRIRAKSAANLPNADLQFSQLLGLSSKRTGSDPYCYICMGAQSFRSATQKNTCDPEWASEIGDFAVYNTRQEVELDVFDDDFGLGKDDHLGGAKICVSMLLEASSYLLKLQPQKKAPAASPVDNGTPRDSPPSNDGLPSDDAENPNLQSPKRAKWNVFSKVKGFMKKDKSEEILPTLEIGVTKLSLVPCNPPALEKIRAGGKGPSEGMLGVTIYGLAPMGARMPLEEVQNILIRTTLRKQGSTDKKEKNEDQRITKKGKIREDTPVPEGVDRNVMKMIQNMRSLHPDFSIERISDIMEVGEETVSKVLAVKKLMPVAINELNYFFVGSCMEDVVLIELVNSQITKSKDLSKAVLASLEVPVKDVTVAEGHVLSETFVLRETGKDYAQDYELAMKFQVWALEEVPTNDETIRVQ